MEYIKLCDSVLRFMCVVWGNLSTPGTCKVMSGTAWVEKIHDLYGCTENVCEKGAHCQ